MIQKGKPTRLLNMFKHQDRRDLQRQREDFVITFITYTVFGGCVGAYLFFKYVQ